MYFNIEGSNSEFTHLRVTNEMYLGWQSEYN